jgi:integrase
MAHITKRMVEGLTPSDLVRPGREFIFWDDKIKGFGVRLQPSGAKTYVFQYRAGGGRAAPRRRITIARVGDIELDQARTLAEQARGAVAHGRDPAAEKTARNAADTVRQLAEFFLAEIEAKRKRTTAAHYRLILEKHVLPRLGNRKAAEVATAEVAHLHNKLSVTPYIANRMLAVVGSMYAFARKRHIVGAAVVNPAREIDKYPERRKERFLSVAEVRALAEAVREAETIGLPYDVDETKPKAKHAPKAKNRRTKIGPHACAALRLLLLTGARLREILDLEWSHVDMDRGLLLLPDSKTGQKTIVLNDPALDTIKGLSRVGRYVIAGESAGTEDEKPRADLKAPWQAVCKRGGLKGVRIHDLRHTHASFGAGAGLGLPIIGKLLGHTQAATTQRYAHLDAGPLFRASNLIASQIVGAMGEPPRDPDVNAAGGANIVPMPMKKR